MKQRYLLAYFVVAALLAGMHLTLDKTFATPSTYETARDLVTAADFDGDGDDDLVIVDKQSGKYRLAYQTSAGEFNWVRFRHHDVKYITGIGIGNLLAPNKLALILASSDSGQVLVVDVSDPAVPGTPVQVPMLAVGPNVAGAAHIGGSAGLYVCSIYNADPANLLTLFQSKEGEFSQVSETGLPGSMVHPKTIALPKKGSGLVASIVQGDEGDSFRLVDLSSGKPVAVAEIKEVPAGTSFVVGKFSDAAQDLVFYVSGETTLRRAAIQQAGSKIELSPVTQFELENPIKQLFTFELAGKSHLLAILGEGESVGIFSFDGKKAPALVQSVAPDTGDVFFGAVPYADGFLTYSSTKGMRMATKYAVYLAKDGKMTATQQGKLGTLADTDETTVPAIRKHIVEQTPEKCFADMKPYTNTIPGTAVSYVMVPIPGGEYTMGSPENEAGRKDDEVQHKVKIEPFWMGMFEVTWNEYEIFQYPDDEKQLRNNYPTEDYVNQVSDAVTRPSKPYVEMSFGMGKDGYPAIAMTHHGANKYCHWLSSKTGHFYRLPTEAEWEYACRAGTTTAFSFGDDASKLGEYAWFGMNSDFKYQKIGRKKPNPWGLYDMHGNVTEWCLDQYDAKFYSQFIGKIAVEPWNRATEPYPHVARGGHWDSEDVSLFRSAARWASSRAWKAQDPQLPKSYWWLSDAQFVGFRIIRPLGVPEAAMMTKYWITGTEKD